MYHMATPPVLAPASYVTCWTTFDVEPLNDMSVGAEFPAPQITIKSSVPPSVNVNEGLVAVENAVTPVESTNEIAICYFFSNSILILNLADSTK